MNPKSHPWTILSTECYYGSKYVAVEEDQLRHASGRVHSYTALRFKVHGIAVLPIDKEGCTNLVGQFRYLLRQYT